MVPTAFETGLTHLFSSLSKFDAKIMCMKNRTYIINHSLFDNLNEQSAYILGFWLADGNIALSKNPHGQSYSKRFALYNTDYQIMSELGLLIGHAPAKIKIQEKHHKQCYCIQVNSNQLFEYCYAITGTTDKSHANFALPTIPDELFNHFVRGFFDGDGSIHIAHYTTRHGKRISRLTTGFTAGNATNHLLHLRDKLCTIIGVGNKQITGKDSKRLSYNQYDSMLLCEWMYNKATIYMERKKDIWDNADKERLLNSKKFFSNKV